MTEREGRTARQRVFGVFERGDKRLREVSSSRSALSSPSRSAREALRFGRDVAPRRPHTMSVYQRPRNSEQTPRWFQHRTSDNWNQKSYVYSPVRARDASNCLAQHSFANECGNNRASLPNAILPLTRRSIGGRPRARAGMFPPRRRFDRAPPAVSTCRLVRPLHLPHPLRGFALLGLRHGKTMTRWVKLVGTIYTYRRRLPRLVRAPRHGDGRADCRIEISLVAPACGGTAQGFCQPGRRGKCLQSVVRVFDGRERPCTRL